MLDAGLAQAAPTLIEKSLAHRHRGRWKASHCPLAAFGHNRDKKGKRRWSSACSAPPTAAQSRSSLETATPPPWPLRFQDRFHRPGRRMITPASDLSPAGLDWISALRTESASCCTKGLRPETQWHPHGERLLVCLNPRLRQQRARKREGWCRPPKPSWQRDRHHRPQATRRPLPARPHKDLTDKPGVVPQSPFEAEARLDKAS